MSARSFEEFETEVEECNNTVVAVVEASPSTKLERRRKIEDLYDEKKLRLELEEFG